MQRAAASFGKQALGGLNRRPPAVPRAHVFSPALLLLLRGERRRGVVGRETDCARSLGRMSQQGPMTTRTPGRRRRRLAVPSLLAVRFPGLRSLGERKLLVPGSQPLGDSVSAPV